MPMPIEPGEYARQVEVLRPALLAFAAKRLPRAEDAEDAVSDAILGGLQSLSSYDPTTGQAGLVRLLYTLLRRRIADRQHQAMADAAHTAETVEAESHADARWAMLNGQRQRADLSDIELVAEARLRLRIAPLTDRQRQVFAARLRGATYREIASRFGISQSTAQEHVCAAIRVLRRVPLDVIAAADLPHYAFRVGSLVTIYHRPSSWGAGRWREALRRLGQRPALHRRTARPVSESQGLAVAHGAE